VGRYFATVITVDDEWVMNSRKLRPARALVPRSAGSPSRRQEQGAARVEVDSWSLVIGTRIDACVRTCIAVGSPHVQRMFLTVDDEVRVVGVVHLRRGEVMVK
jgi:hypothetical protein